MVQTLKWYVGLILKASKLAVVILITPVGAWALYSYTTGKHVNRVYIYATIAVLCLYVIEEVLEATQNIIAHVQPDTHTKDSRASKSTDGGKHSGRPPTST